jgi:hypothetical protein
MAKEITTEETASGTYLLETLPDGRRVWLVLVRHQEDVPWLRQAVIDHYDRVE